MADPVKTFVHDHAEIHSRILALAKARRSLADDAPSSRLRAPLDELRDLLFLHFAREEEALFPFVATAVAELVPEVDALAVAHDTICGSLARMVQLAATAAPASALAPLVERFEAAYASHALAEASVLGKLDARLTPEQRDQLARLVDGI